MREKPKLIYVIVAGLILVPIVFFLKLFFFTEEIAPKFDSTAWVLIFLVTCISYSIAYGVWKVRLWAFYALVIFGLLTTVLDLYSWKIAGYKFSYWLLLDFFAVAAGLTLIVQDRVRQPYFNPKIRWWETAKRTKVDIPATFSISNQSIAATILDISQSGCFAHINSEFKSAMIIGKEFFLEVVFQSKTFQTNCIVIRASQSPEGFGLKFKNVTRENQKIVDQIIKSLASL